MKDNFKYKNWDLQNYIELERKAKNLTENDLENVSGGIMNRKLAASVLTGLSILTVSSNFTETTAATQLHQQQLFKMKSKIKMLILK